MNWLRSHLLVAIISLFVGMGYAHDLVGGCADAKSTSSACKQDASAAHAGDACQCVCHQVARENTPEFAVSPTEVVLETHCFPMEGGFPPDSVPLGIDYPPQLA